MSTPLAVPAASELGRTTRCARCERLLTCQGVSLRKMLGGAPVLPDTDFCRWCARPVIERAERLADNAAFVRLARMILGERRPAVPMGPIA